MELEKVNVKLPDVSDIDLGYAAGFYEGEGSVCSTNDSSCCVNITQKDSEPLVKLQELFGGNINLYNGYHYWRLYGDECKAFIVLIFNQLSARRRKQIEKYENFFYSIECCPNKHPYEDGSFRIVDDSRGRIHRQCLICAKAKNKRKNTPANRIAIEYANVSGMSKEEAMKYLYPKKFEEDISDEDETIQ